MKNISKYKVEYGILIPLIIFAIISITTVYSAQNLLPEYSSNLYLKHIILYVLAFGILTVFFTVIPVWNIEIAEKPLVFISVLTNLKLRALLISSVLLITLLGYVVRRYFHGPKYIYWITLVFSVICLSLIFSLALGKFLKDYQIKRNLFWKN